MLPASRHRQEAPARHSPNDLAIKLDSDVELAKRVHYTPDQHQGVVRGAALTAHNLVAVAAEDGGNKSLNISDNHLRWPHGQPAAAPAAGGGVHYGETAEHHNSSATAAPRQPHIHQRCRTFSMCSGPRLKYTSSNVACLRVQAHRQQQLPQSLDQKLAVWQQLLDQQKMKQQCEGQLQVDAQAEPDTQAELDQGYHHQKQQQRGTAAASAAAGNNAALGACPAGGSHSPGPSEADPPRDKQQKAAVAVAAAFRRAHDPTAAVAAAGATAGKELNPCSLKRPRYAPIAAVGVDSFKALLRSAAPQHAPATVDPHTASLHLHSPAVEAAACCSHQNTSLKVTPGRSAAARADAAIKQQLQRTPRPPTPLDPAAEAVNTKIDQTYLKVRVHQERVWQERCEKFVGTPRFQPLLPHEVMKQDGGILNKARIMETGRLIAQARCELDAGGPDSPTFEIYQDDESKWKMDRDAEYNGAPLVKLLDLKCMVNQPLVFSCQPFHYRSSPLGDEDLLSECARATLVPASGIGNEIKCCNSNCARHATWQRYVYERRHLKISRQTQEEPVYNSSRHWMLEKLGCSLQTFGMAVHDGYLNTAWCIFCNRGDGGPLSGFDDTWGAKPDNLKPCSTCPMACHKTCYTAFTGDLDIPENHTLDDDAFWQCISCRQAAACAAAGCEWCEEVRPNTIDYELMEQDYGRFEQEAADAATAAEAAVAAAQAAAALAGTEEQLQPRKRKQQQKGRRSGGNKSRRQSCQKGQVAESDPSDSATDTDDDAGVAEVVYANKLVLQQQSRLSATGLQVDTTPYTGVRLLAATKIASPGQQPTPAAGPGAGTSAAAAAAASPGSNIAAGPAGSALAASGGTASPEPAAAGGGNHCSSQTAAEAAPADDFADPGVSDTAVEAPALVVGGDLAGITVAAAEAQGAAHGVSNKAPAAAATLGSDIVSAPAVPTAQNGSVLVRQVTQGAGSLAAQQNTAAPGQGPTIPGPAATAPAAAAGGGGVSRGPLKQRLGYLKSLKDRELLIEDEYKTMLRCFIFGEQQEQLKKLEELVELADEGDLTREEFELLKQDFVTKIAAAVKSN